ncbi:MAG TPA: hypothetical protein VM513_14585 [Kofleriaceae bacterium]|jgi:hypothetical protein|nr:hypothetical protein [Kofleriaceae bacterium]
MLSRSRGLRLGLLLLTSLGYVAAIDTWTDHSAYAQDDEEDEEDSGDDEGGDDEGGDEGEGDEEEEEDPKEQPPITAGGLFTLRTYPVREISRPLSMTEKIVQLRLSAGTDISAKGAFESGGLSVEGIYGVKDNFSLIGGLTNAYNFKQFGVYFGFEGALAYDLVNFRLAANIHRTALPEYCGQFDMSMAPSDCTDPTSGEFQPELPTGNFDAGGVKFSLDLGFPFRYAIRPEIAIVALQTLMSIDFNSIDDGYTILQEDSSTGTLTPRTVRNGAKPDLNPSLGIATNPIAPLSVVIFAQLRIPDFDTSAGAFQVPVTGRLQFSPNQKFDIGLEFTLLNVKPPEGQSPIDNRFLALFMQTRVGR